MNLSDLFTKQVITAGPAESLASVARKMRDHNVGTVVIAEDERPVGIVTDRDLALALGAEGLGPQTPAREVMNCHVIAVPEDTSVFTATNYMRDCHVRRLPVVDRDDRLVGMVSLDDLLRYLGRELFNLAEGIKAEVAVR